MTITHQCAECGTQYRLAANLAGKKAKCKKCGTTMVIRPVEEAVPAVRVPPPVAASLTAAPSSPIGQAMGAPAWLPPEMPAGVCPSCQRPLMPNAAFCTSCGFNLRTGQRVMTTVAKKQTRSEAFFARMLRNPMTYVVGVLTIVPVMVFLGAALTAEWAAAVAPVYLWGGLIVAAVGFLYLLSRGAGQNDIYNAVRWIPYIRLIALPISALVGVLSNPMVAIVPLCIMGYGGVLAGLGFVLRVRGGA